MRQSARLDLSSIMAFKLFLVLGVALLAVSAGAAVISPEGAKGNPDIKQMLKGIIL